MDRRYCVETRKEPILQHGPDTPSKSPETVIGELVAQEPVVSDLIVDEQARVDQTNASPGEMVEDTAQESVEGESFFQTWAKGQDMPMGTSLLFMAGVILALIAIMRSLMKSSAKRKHQTRTMGDPSERIEKINDRARGTMEPARQAMVDAENLTRRMGAVLDTKAMKIEILLAEATERIAELERANRDIPRPRAVEPVESVESSGISEALDRARLDQDRAERTWVEGEDSEVSASVPTFRIDRGLGAKAREESPHPLTFPEQVDELATRGMNALEIANKLNRLVGEVELVLNLRRNSG